MSALSEKQIDDGPALVYRTIADFHDQLSESAQKSLHDAFDGNKIVMAKNKELMELLGNSKHLGDESLYGVLQEIDFTTFETKKKTIKLKTNADMRHHSHGKIQAALLRVPGLSSHPKTFTAPKEKNKTSAGKTTSSVVSLLKKLREASQRRTDVRNKVRMPPKIA